MPTDSAFFPEYLNCNETVSPSTDQFHVFQTFSTGSIQLCGLLSLVQLTSLFILFSRES